MYLFASWIVGILTVIFDNPFLIGISILTLSFGPTFFHIIIQIAQLHLHQGLLPVLHGKLSRLFMSSKSQRLGIWPYRGYSTDTIICRVNRYDICLSFDLNLLWYTRKQIELIIEIELSMGFDLGSLYFISFRLYCGFESKAKSTSVSVTHGSFGRHIFRSWLSQPYNTSNSL